MSGNILNIRNLLSKKFILLVSLILISSINNISCVNYNRGPLEENHPTNSNENNNIDDDDEFTGNTYIEPTENPNEHNDDSLLELESDISDDSYDQDEDDEDDDEDEDINDLDDKQDDSDDYLDRVVDSSLLEMESTSLNSSTYGLDQSEKLDDTGKIKPKYLNDNKLKEYLRKVGALDKMKSAKNKGKEAYSSMKSKIRSIPESYRRMKGKIHPSKGVYEANGSYSNGNNSDHRRRLLDTMNEVDERRRERGSDYDTHSNSNNENKVEHRRRLLNTMNDVDERRKKREHSRIGEIKRRFRRN